MALFEKIVGRRRGGFCYELNGLFALLLEGLGYRVHRLSARTFSAAHGYSPPMDHLALHVVDATGTAWLADVGFGRHTEFPLRFDDRATRRIPAACSASRRTTTPSSPSCATARRSTAWTRSRWR